MPRTISLQSKIAMLVACMTIVTVSVIVWFDSYTLRRSVEETYVGQLNGITTAINGRYEESHSIEDVQQIFDYIQYKTPNVLRLTLFGQDEILASTDRDLIGEASPPALIEGVEKGQMMIAHLRGDRDGVPKVRLQAPLMEDGVTIGAIELLLDTTDNAKLIRGRTLFIVIVGVSVALLLMISLSVIIRRMLIRPLLALRKAAISVRGGSPYEPVTLDCSPEIHEVMEAFNEMVADQERRYAELQEAQNQLVESEKMAALGSLVAGVSHEINTPIGIGVTASSYLDEKTREFLKVYRDNRMRRSDLEDYLRAIEETSGMIQTNLQRASELIRSFKQVAVDHSSQAKRTFEVKEYVQDVLVSLKPQLKKTNHRVTVSGPDGFRIYGDPGAFSQILTNLIMNSLIHAYGPDDRGSITIDLSVEDEKLILLYTDDGRGMEPEVAEKIFLPFFTTNRGGGGTGLGMHIVYNLVTQSLGGTIRCGSSVGAGAFFRIEIPIREG